MAKSRPFLLKLYAGAMRVFGPITGPAVLRWRLKRGKEMANRIGERRGRATRMRPEGLLVWVHAASVGELMSVLPLVEAITERGFAVLVTTGTVTSAQVAARRLPPDAIHQFVPLDVPGFIKRFFNHWRPDIAIFAESELWPNLMGETARREVPLIIANARLSERSFRRWSRARRIIGALLERADLCLAQSDEDARRLAALGAPRVQTTGNLKFDVPPPPASPEMLARIRRQIAGRPVFLAASTHEGEEEIIARVHREVRKRVRNVLTVMVPRHPDRASGVLAMLEADGFAVSLRSRHADALRGADMHLVDTIGELGLFYRIADVAFIGGSLVLERGGQNPIEPGKLGVPILHGPHVANFRQVYAALDDAGGALRVDDEETFGIAVAGLLSDPQERETMRRAAGEVVHDLSGALDRTITAIDPYLIQLRLAER